MNISEIQECTCGALTVYWENGTNTSMTPETFDETLPDKDKTPTLNKSYNCNHCVNHWGLDLCGCGSGETVGKCEGEFDQCINSEPSQNLYESKKFVGWVR